MTPSPSPVKTQAAIARLFSTFGARKIWAGSICQPWRASNHPVSAGISRVLQPGACFCLYGPFNYHDAFTSPSNERFHAWLRARDPDSGVRNFEDLDALARAAGLTLKADHEMPVNNRLLVWEKMANA